MKIIHREKLKELLVESKKTKQLAINGERNNLEHIIKI